MNTTWRKSANNTSISHLDSQEASLTTTLPLPLDLSTPPSEGLSLNLLVLAMGSLNWSSSFSIWLDSP